MEQNCAAAEKYDCKCYNFCSLRDYKISLNDDARCTRCPDLRCNNEDDDPIKQSMKKLTREISRKLAKDKVDEGKLQRYEKSVYRMKQDHLTRRMQGEEKEKFFQDCICRDEKDKARRHELICQEEKFAVAMRKTKEEETREAAFSKQLYACAPEIRELERQLRRAYFAKTLFAQRVENECLRLEEKRKDDSTHQQLMEQLAQYDQALWEKKQQDCVKKKEYFKALSSQLEDAMSKKSLKAEDFAKDKEMVDEIIASIEKEELQDLMDKHEKVKMYQSEIGDFLQARESHRERERARVRTEEEQIQKYTQNKKEQAEEFHKIKESQEKAKAQIVAKAIERIMTEQYRIEELEELRRQLHEEEMIEDAKRKDAEYRDRIQKQKNDLRASAEEARRMRGDKLEAERKEEDEYRQQLMAKFAEDERLEQMATQKRRQREREHRKIVEQMIIDRRCLHAQQREKDQATLECFDLETKRRQDIIDAERVKLLKEHGPCLLGFIPRGVIKDWKELERLGEPFLTYYRNQPVAPDPTTIDAEPCEEELFKTMEVPKYVKY